MPAQNSTIQTPPLSANTDHQSEVKNKQNGWLLALVATISFSFAAPIARYAIRSGIDATTLVTLRLLLATVLTVFTVGAIDRRRLQMNRRGMVVAWTVGVINGFGMLLFFWALERVDASIASMMISLIPLVVLSLLALRGERFTYRQIVRMFLGLSGVYLLIGPGGNVNPTGVLLLTVAVFCFSIHITLLQWYLRDYEALTVASHISAAMTLAVGSWWLLRGVPWQPLPLQGWLALIALAVFATYLARLCYVSAVAHLGSGQVSLLSPLETFLTVVWSMLFLGERLSPLQWVGGGLVMCSALLAIQRLGRATWRPRWRLWSKV